jgi:urease accessory protein
MHRREILPVQGWQAGLDLGYVERGEQTILQRRLHYGPLAMQKSLYPEGAGVCHNIVLHPPGGIAGGDRLEITVELGSGSHALLTTPGAAKWYRSSGPEASQQVRLGVGEEAVLEWLPQEAIVFDGAIMRTQLEIELARSAAFIGWECLCLGRSAAGERFRTGTARFVTRLLRDGALLWQERAYLPGGGAVLDAVSGFAGKPVSGLLLACGPGIDHGLLARCRELAPTAGDYGVTMLPGLIVARHLCASTEPVKEWFVRLWQVLRPALTGRNAVLPRIWST